MLPTLYAIIDVDVSLRAGWPPLELARAYLNGGARLLQLRAKRLESGAFLDLAAALQEESRNAGAVLVVNDRADIAALAAAAGVHVGQEDLAPAAVRKIVGDQALVGLSTHHQQQIDEAVRQPISYLAVGPVYPTDTKATGYDQVGLALVHAAVRAATAASLPVVAIGGITLDTAPAVIEAGAASVAVIADLLGADPETRIRRYLAVLR